MTGTGVGNILYIVPSGSNLNRVRSGPRVWMDQNAFAHKKFSVVLPGFCPDLSLQIGAKPPITAKDRLSLTPPFFTSLRRTFVFSK